MSKIQEFHEQINKALADKYQTTPKVIGAIRGVVIQEEFQFVSYLDFIEAKLAILNSPEKRNFYMDLYVFTRKLNDETWREVTQRVAFRD